jgi:hypothetical protein
VPTVFEPFPELANRDAAWTMMAVTTASMNSPFTSAATSCAQPNPYECFAET